MEAKRYEYGENIVDTEIFKADELTFNVLKNIVNQKSRLVITDHERFVICHSCAPYPVWIWVPEDVTEGELEHTWEILKKEFSFADGYGFNTKYRAAEFYVKRSREEGTGLAITLHMSVYDCRETICPERKPEGGMVLPVTDDLQDMADFIWEFKQEIGVDKEEKEACRSHAEALLESDDFYLWKNSRGENVAMCSINADEKTGRLGLVYTKPGERRKGYGEWLVYQVTNIIRERGLLPVLYADTEYSPSNGCYLKIGYTLQGKLCSFGKA